MGDPSVTIVTLSRNRAYVDRLTDALDALDAEPADRMEVGAFACGVPRILIDNGIGWGPVQPGGHQFSYRDWKIVRPGWNTSFSEGCNIAMERVRTPYVLLLNDDLVPEPGFVERLFRRREGLGILGALILHSDGTVNHAGTAVWKDCRTDHLGRHGKRDDWEAPRAQVVPAVTFAAALIECVLWRRLGGLDERYVYGWEDPDFCLRALEAGARIGVALDAVAVHDECGTRPRGGSRDQMNEQTFHGTWRARMPALLEGYAAREPQAMGVNS